MKIGILGSGMVGDCLEPSSRVSATILWAHGLGPGVGKQKKRRACDSSGGALTLRLESLHVRATTANKGWRFAGIPSCHAVLAVKGGARYPSLRPSAVYRPCDTSPAACLAGRAIPPEQDRSGPEQHSQNSTPARSQKRADHGDLLEGFGHRDRQAKHAADHGAREVKYPTKIPKRYQNRYQN